MSRFKTNNASAFGANASVALQWVKDTWKLQTENSYYALHFVRSLSAPINHCELFLTFSRIIDMKVKRDELEEISLVVRQLHSRNAV